MKHYLTVLIGLFSLVVVAQKDTARQIDGKGIKQLYIETDEVFRINLKTVKGDRFLITTHSEGEYYNDIALNTKVDEETLYLSTEFQEILQSGYDKLSAHKVFSLEITLEVPENLQVIISSNIAAVEAKGVYESLQIELKTGYCNLNDFQGNAVINTYDGAVSVKTSGATVMATSRNGKVILPANFSGNHSIKVTSINGDIRVEKN